MLLLLLCFVVVVCFVFVCCYFVLVCFFGCAWRCDVVMCVMVSVISLYMCV